jgi:methylated-DNA-protein-cysteine methyltransferase-like protein
MRDDLVQNRGRESLFAKPGHTVRPCPPDSDSPATPRSETFARIYDVVRRIPRGSVLSYGDVARLAGLRNGARTVGWALASMPDFEKAPWWRVVRADGRIAPRPFATEQRRRLRAEGVSFGRNGAIRD